MKTVMTPVKDNRAFMKGGGACVNVDDLAYNTRIKRMKAEREKDIQIQNLQTELGELKTLVQQLLVQGKQ